MQESPNYAGSAAAAAVAPGQWFYMEGEQRKGPLGPGALTALVRSGHIQGTSLVWTPGMEEWLPLAQTPLWSATSAPAPKATPGETEKGLLALVRSMISALSGLPQIRGFKVSSLFSGAFKWRTGDDLDAQFNVGCSRTTPALLEVKADWPQPGAFPRILLLGLVASVIMVLTTNSNTIALLPGMLFACSFTVPLACLVFVFELNILRNMSMTRVVGALLLGGFLSLFVTTLLNSFESNTTGMERWIGASIAGPVEETAKLIAALFFLGLSSRFGWTLNGLLVGAAVGAGFAGFETAGYGLAGLLTSGFDATIRVLILRGILAPFMHVIWTACVVGALCRVRAGQSLRIDHFLDWRFLRIFLLVVVLHMVWNTPWRESLLHEAGAAGLRLSFAIWAFLCAGSWYLMLMLAQQGILEVRAAQDLARLKHNHAAQGAPPG